MCFSLISVIVPNYNHEKYLKERLDSIFSQTYLNFEVILLDDCSTDNSRDILSQYSQHPKVSHCVFNDVNTGNTFVQWNKGIALAKGEFIWIAESDDFCDSNFLEEVCKPLIENEKVVLSYCQSNRVDEKGKVFGNWKTHTDSLSVEQFENDFVLEGNLFIENYLICKNVIPNASAVVLKKKYLQIPNDLISSNELKYCGDWVIYLQQIINHKVAFVASSMNSFRFHNSSVIAKASKSESRISIIDIDVTMRKLMFSILKKNKPINYRNIAHNSKNIVKSLKYEKALFFIRNHKRWKGIFLLIGIFDEFLRRYPFKKSLVLKFKTITS
jgi:glycosyltransferase involved in cell wall biosynthesis